MRILKLPLIFKFEKEWTEIGDIQGITKAQNLRILFLELFFTPKNTTPKVKNSC